MQETITALRRFNRFHTRLMGLFSRRLLDSPLNLAEARALYEIVASPGVSAADLSRELGMDRGQLSRILARLLKQDLVTRQGRPTGRKALPLHPTEQGRTLLATLEDAADKQAAALLAPLDVKDRERLREALDEVRAILGDSLSQGVKRKVTLREAASGDLGWIITRHAETYGCEHGFSQEFEAYVLLGMAEYLRQDTGRSQVWVAELDGAAAGSVGVVELSKTRAQLRWLLVEPWARGLGLGRKLVARALAFGQKQGFKELVLWTLRDLHAARRLYASMSFELRETKKGLMGGRAMTEECWVCTLE